MSLLDTMDPNIPPLASGLRLMCDPEGCKVHVVHKGKEFIEFVTSGQFKLPTLAKEEQLIKCTLNLNEQQK